MVHSDADGEPSESVTTSVTKHIPISSAAVPPPQRPTLLEPLPDPWCHHRGSFSFRGAGRGARRNDGRPRHPLARDQTTRITMRWSVGGDPGNGCEAWWLVDTTNRPRPMERSLATGQGPAEGCRAARRAFSLVELLVVMAVVAIVAMLSLPAIQSAREAARRIACRDNLRHLALGVLEHESATRRLPPAARVTEASNPATCTGCWNPWLEAGLGGAAPGTRDGASWMLSVLPYLEQMSLHGRWDFATNVRGNASVARANVPGFYCPSRRAGIRVDRHDHRSLLDPAWRGAAPTTAAATAASMGSSTTPPPTVALPTSTRRSPARPAGGKASSRRTRAVAWRWRQTASPARSCSASCSDSGRCRPPRRRRAPTTAPAKMAGRSAARRRCS